MPVPVHALCGVGGEGAVTMIGGLMVLKRLKNVGLVGRIENPP
jgi:hypothetical protein